jgi:membrane dipeptidase
MVMSPQVGGYWAAARPSTRIGEPCARTGCDDRAVVADLHNDLLLELTWRRHRAREDDVFARTWLPLLEAGGVGLQVCPVFVELDRQPEGALREALGQVAAFHAAVRETERAIAVRTAADVDAVERKGALGLLLALEGVEPFGYDVHTAEIFVELGLRMASLTWNRRNPFADGVAEDEDGGLSRLGRELVDRLVELGVVLDLAHASPRTFADVLEHSGEAPVLVSHAACRAVHDHPRNLSDDQLRVLAWRGGLLGMMLLPLVVGLDRPTIDGAIDHLEHAVEVMGVEHVALGGDFTVRLARELPPEPLPADSLTPPGVSLDSALEGLSGPEHYPALQLALRARGWSETDVEAVMGGNVVSFLRAALPP